MNIDVMKFIDAGATPEEIYAAAKKAAQEKKEKDAAVGRITEARKVALDAVVKYAEAVLGDKIDEDARKEVEKDLIEMETFFSKMRKPTPKVAKRQIDNDTEALINFLAKLGLN